MTRPDLSRRAVLTGLAGLATGGGALATQILSPSLSAPALNAMSRWNDRVQGALFDADPVPQYDTAQITSPFPFNGIYPPSLAPDVDPAAWRLDVSGRVTRPLSLSLDALRRLPAAAQTTRLICIEGWSAIGRWAGPSLPDILKAAGADRAARYVAIHCADGYWTSLDMASALHPQTILALDFLDRPLPRAFGQPARLRIPTKLGFKNAKHVTALKVTNDWVGGYWEDQGYNWFAGI